MLNAASIIEMHDNGVIVEMHAINLLLETATGQEILDLPDEWQTRVLSELDRLPRTDQEWNRMVFFGDASQSEARRRWKKLVFSLREQLGRN